MSQGIQRVGVVSSGTAQIGRIVHPVGKPGVRASQRGALALGAAAFPDGVLPMGTTPGLRPDK